MSELPPMSFVRSLHPYAYRSGEWAQVVGERFRDGRKVYLLVWPDGATDEWAAMDPQGDYEFSDEVPVDA